MLIGANDFGFAGVVERCLTNWLTSPTWWKNYCHDDAMVRNMFTDAYIAEQRARVQNAYANIRQAMANAGYGTGDYQLQEDLHPGYWGQLALGNCVRQVYVSGRGGTCRGEGGMDGTEPNMALD